MATHNDPFYAGSDNDDDSSFSLVDNKSMSNQESDNDPPSSVDTNEFNEVYLIAKRGSKSLFLWRLAVFFILLSTCALIVVKTNTITSAEYHDDDEEEVSNFL